MEARLPLYKLEYLSLVLSSWVKRSQCTLRELQELVGYLQFCSQVIPYALARAFIRSLFDFTSSFRSPFSHRTIPRAARRDLNWWCRFAVSWNGIHFISPSRPNPGALDRNQTLYTIPKIPLRFNPLFFLYEATTLMRFSRIPHNQYPCQSKGKYSNTWGFRGLFLRFFFVLKYVYYSITNTA